MWSCQLVPDMCFLRMASIVPLLCTFDSNVGKLLVCGVWCTDNERKFALPFLLFVSSCFAKILELLLTCKLI